MDLRCSDSGRLVWRCSMGYSYIIAADVSNSLKFQEK